MRTSGMLYGFALALLTACGGAKTEREASPVMVKVDTVTAAEDGGSWQLPGRVKASEEVNVAFKVSGTLRRVCVKAGQQVRAGQLLAEMDDTDYRVQLKATTAEYEGIKAEAGRVTALYEAAGTTASNYDKARYGMEQIEAKLAHHRNQLAYCRLTAPTNGTVQALYFEGGETVGQGMPVMQIVGGGSREIEVALPAHVYVQADAIKSATATFSAFPGHTYLLTPLKTLPKANVTGLYSMRLRLETVCEKDGGANTHEMPSPGMSGWVTLSSEMQTAATMQVPVTAVVHGDGGDHVFVLQGGKARTRRVQIQSLDGMGDARVTGELQPGDVIVAAGANHLTDGQEVTPLKEKSATNVGGLL